MTKQTTHPKHEHKPHGRKTYRRHLFFVRLAGTLFTLCALGALCMVLFVKPHSAGGTDGGPEFLRKAELPEWVDVQIIPVNGVGRRGVPLEDIQDIVIHYVGNPGTTAQQNHDYYARKETKVSSHFLVGLEGEVIQCVPLNEKSSATNERNRDTISIEVCHPDDTGKFTDAAYDSVVKLTVWLCELCDFDSTHVIRHYDVTGKECPRYFVRNEDAWVQFRADVEAALTAPAVP